MSLRIRRGTDAQRSGITFDMGEIVWTTDGQQLWVGDGLTQGGFPVVGANITGYGLVYDSVNKRIEVSGLTADDITNGANNKFFSAQLAQDAAASLFVTGTHQNITFIYDDELGKINASVTLDGVGISEIISDTSPQLGGNLDLNDFNITGFGDITISGEITGESVNTSKVSLTSTGITTPDGDLIINSFTGQMFVGTDLSPLDAVFTPVDKIRVKGIPSLSTPLGGAYIVLEQQRGSYTTPVSINAGDTLGGLDFKPFVGTKHVDAGFITFRQDDSVPFVPDSNFTASVFTVVPATATGFINLEDGSLLTFNSKSVLATKIFKSNGLTTAARDALTPEEGMMIYNTSTKKFQGYTGDAGEGDPGWVDLH